eukprot:scaffold437_cov111-Cylindrotheca_fusiformis.AAC.11
MPEQQQPEDADAPPVSTSKLSKPKKSKKSSAADDGSVGTKKKKKSSKKDKDKPRSSKKILDRPSSSSKKKERNSSFHRLKDREKLPDISGSSPAVIARKKAVIDEAGGKKKKSKSSKSKDKRSQKKEKKKNKSKRSKEDESSEQQTSLQAPPLTDEAGATAAPNQHSEKVLRKKLEKADRLLSEMPDPTSDKYKKLQSKRQEYETALDSLIKAGSGSTSEFGEMGLNDEEEENASGGYMDLNDDGEEGEMGLNDDDDEDDDEERGSMDLNDEEGEMGLRDDNSEVGLRRSKSLQEMNPAWSRSFRAEKEKEKRRQDSLGRHQERKKSMREKDRNKSTKKRTRGIRQALNADEDFKVPVFEKNKEENEFLKASLKGDFVFQNLEKKSFRMFIDAFELVEYEKGQDIIKEGDIGDYFYVVAEGKVKYYVKDRLVGRGERGKSFGEAALLYTAPRSATVRAAVDSKLYRVDQQTFKFITQRSAQELRQQKLELLRNVDFLDDLLNDDLQRLCDLMVPRIVYKGDYLYQKDADADAFYILQSGEMKATDIVVGDTVFEDIAIHPGDYFGQNALARDAPRENSVLAVEESTVYGIDRTTFDKVLGSFYNVILKTNDRQLLVSILCFLWHFIELPCIADTKLFVCAPPKTGSYQGEEIFAEGEDIEPALFLIRDGTVNISVGEGDEIKTVQEDVYFGDDILLSRSDIVPARYTVTAVDDVICGKLTVSACRLVLDLQPETSADGSMELSDLTLSNNATMQRRSELSASFESDELTVEELEKIKIVGEGEYGKVWLTKCKGLDEVFALKVQQLEQDGESFYDNIKREVATIGCLHHPYIVGLITSKFTGNECFMVMDFITGGELWSVIHREENGVWSSGLSSPDSKFYALIIADTISYMHRRNILFRDLKPENVMIDNDGYPNIIDFGFAKVCEDKTFTFCGTPNYVAPEIVLNAGHGVGVDHWALGVMIYEMLSGENPFWYDGIDTMTLYEIIVKDEPYPLEPEISEPNLEHLLDGLLEKDPSQRMGVLAGKDKDILFHKWFEGLDLQELRHKRVKAPWLPPPPAED